MFLRDALNEHLVTFGCPESDGLVFTVPSGSPLRNSNFAGSIWHPAIEATGLPSNLRIHDLRHTAVALMIAEGAHPEKIKRHLGHSSITVTMDTYGHLFPAEDDVIADRLHERRTRALADNRRTRSN